MKNLTYYVRRCRRKTGIETYETLHAADFEKTFCGKLLNEMWYIEESAGVGKLTINDISCRQCKKQIKKIIKHRNLN